MEYVFGSTFVCKSIDAAKEVNSFWQSSYLCSYLSNMILFECFVDAIFQILVFLLHFWKKYFLGIYIKAQSLTYFCSIALNNSAKKWNYEAHNDFTWNAAEKQKYISALLEFTSKHKVSYIFAALPWIIL